MMRKLLKNKRGAVLEGAVCMMLLVFALCTIMVTNAVVSRQLNNTANKNFMDSIALYQVGDDFCIAVAQYDSERDGDLEFTPRNDAYSATVWTTDSQPNVYHLEVRAANKYEVLLFVDVEKTDDLAGYRILRWSRYRENTKEI